MRDFVAKLLTGLVVRDPKLMFSQMQHLIALDSKPCLEPVALFPVRGESPLLFDFHLPFEERIPVFQELFFKLPKFARDFLDLTLDELFAQAMDDRASVLLGLFRDRSLL